jgi:hypothetical protein
MARMMSGRAYFSKARPDQGYHSRFDCPVGHEIDLEDRLSGNGELPLCRQCFAIGERQQMRPIIETRPFITLPRR